MLRHSHLKCVAAGGMNKRELSKPIIHGSVHCMHVVADSKLVVIMPFKNLGYFKKNLKKNINYRALRKGTLEVLKPSIARGGAQVKFIQDKCTRMLASYTQVWLNEQ